MNEELIKRIEVLENEVIILRNMISTLSSRLKKITNFNIKDNIPDEYVIEKGDTLAKIADKYMSASSLWTDIVEANPQKPQNEEWWTKLEIGEVIKLPSKWKDIKI